MKRIKSLALVDLLALVTLVIMAGSGLVLFLFWPTGSGGAGKNPFYFSEYLGFDHRGWVLIHDWSALIFVILMAVHLAMHYRFMRNIPGNLKK